MCFLAAIAATLFLSLFDLTAAANAAAPVVDIDSPQAADPADPFPDAIMPTLWVHYTVSGGSNIHLECGLDSDVGDCGSAHGIGGVSFGAGVGYTEPLHDGPHTYTLTATDEDTLEATTVVRYFYVLGPEVQIPWASYDIDDNGVIEDDELVQMSSPVSPGFEVIGDEIYDVTCRWDLGASFPCSSPLSATELSIGNHTLTVHATGAYYEDQMQARLKIVAPPTFPGIPQQTPIPHNPGTSGSDLRFSRYGLQGGIRLPLAQSNCPAHFKIRVIIPGHKIRRTWPGFVANGYCRTAGSVGFAGAFKRAKKVRLEVLAPGVKKPVYVKKLTR